MADVLSHIWGTASGEAGVAPPTAVSAYEARRHGSRPRSMVGKVDVDFQLALILSLAAIVGSIAGSLIANRVSPSTLKQAFGWFVVAMACFVLAQELPPLFAPHTVELTHHTEQKRA